MIVWDTEATGLIENPLAGLDQQPRVVEIAAVKLDDVTLEVVDEFWWLIHPGIALPEDFIKVTGITEETIKDAPPFARVYPHLADRFLGERTMVAHNIAYDTAILTYALRRIGKEYNFPWPIEHICTSEGTRHREGTRKGSSGRFKLGELYETLTGTPMPKAHRAMDDVRALVTCFRILRQNGEL